MSKKELNKEAIYWDKRRLSRYKDSEKISEKYINRIKRIYSKANKDINEMLDSVYANYSKDTGLSVSELKKILSKSESKKTFKELQEKGLDKYVKDNYKSRISRLEQIKAQVYARTKEIYSSERIAQEECYKAVINRSYNKAIYDVQNATNFNFTFNQLDGNMMNTLLNTKWSGSQFSNRIWNNTNILAESVSEVIGASLMSGESIEVTARRLRERFNVGKYYAERLVRTETNYMDNQADALAYEELGIDEYVLVATLDGRTSDYCISIDHKHYPYDKMEIGVNYPPFHPNCRCTTRAYLGEEAEKLLKRRARDPETGETKLIPNMSYREWYKKYVGTGLGSDDSFSKIPPHDPPILLEKVNMKKVNIDKLLNKYENMIKNDKIENAIVIRPNGEVYRCFGVEKNVYPNYDLGDKIRNSYITHNHPKTLFSFSNDDRDLFKNYNLKKLRGIDYKYTYELNIDINFKEPMFDDKNIDDEYDGEHRINIFESYRNNYGYKRWKNDK